MNQAENFSTKSKILIVNDDAIELASLVNGLKFEGFHVSGTTDSYLALDNLAHSEFDVVLIDLMIPNLNGLQLARKIRHAFPSVKTILMSDYLLSPVQLAKADTGAIGFVPKPCDFNEIASFIKERLEKNTSLKNSASSSGSKATVTSNSPFDIFAVKYPF
jgi:DNA-binding NtrC family response regulator